MSDFGGHSLSGFDSTSFVLNPDLPEARALQQWYATRGDVPTVSLSTAGQPASDPLRRKTLAGIGVGMVGGSYTGGATGVWGACGFCDGESDGAEYPA